VNKKGSQGDDQEDAMRAFQYKGAAPKKSLGQNWLVDLGISTEIVKSLRLRLDYDSPDISRLKPQHIVEIGPGRGALTRLLISEYPPPEYHITAIEVDSRWVSSLRTEFPSLDVRRGDVLKVDWSALAHEKAGHSADPLPSSSSTTDFENDRESAVLEQKVVQNSLADSLSRLDVLGNLPYNITSEIIFSLLASSAVIRQAVFTCQLEVAERLVARPRTKAYGILSVMVQLYSLSPAILLRIPPSAFRPRPKVNSAVVRLQFPPLPVNPVVTALGEDGTTERNLRSLVRIAFNQRRKTLRNSIACLVEATGRPLPEDWASARPEELEPSQFISLARFLFDSKQFVLGRLRQGR